MQRDLFLDYVPPEAEVIAFPPARRIDLVRSVAGQLLRCKKQAAADRIWRGECWRLEVELAARTISDSDLRAAMLAFRVAVEGEIARQSGGQRGGTA